MRSHQLWAKRCQKGHTQLRARHVQYMARPSRPAEVVDGGVSPSISALCPIPDSSIVPMPLPNVHQPTSGGATGDAATRATAPTALVLAVTAPAAHVTATNITLIIDRVNDLAPSRIGRRAMLTPAGIRSREVLCRRCAGAPCSATPQSSTAPRHNIYSRDDLQHSANKSRLPAARSACGACAPCPWVMVRESGAVAVRSRALHERPEGGGDAPRRRAPGGQCSRQGSSSV